ncbi:dienelactone hydrolase family protein [Phytomonospora endophytica]|uniref:Dienelactone hydrolase n=1 Tax=Phytomonospora endophytica TaxID=714109 RepID=A0A841FKS9_9ACTN|nr:dienelactone hydrolase family protein [Phytomonospora endophytica]MBB6033787.1 dienelactone hydrolase [Phytomonospora endophytica]GIG64695.1 dienelactone hydrolase [Phytomonospora endophytica]
MAEVLLYHHIQGLTDGVRAFAEDLRQAGHTVHTPDLFDGRTFATIQEGFGFARDAGFEAIRERGIAAADQLAPGLVYAGFSFGVTIAQRLAQTRPGARGALLMHSCMPVTEYGDTWPQGLPVQIHGKEGDEFFDEDLPAARELADSTPVAELFVYPGDQHLFADSSLDAYDPQAAALLMERVQAFLASTKEGSGEHSTGSLGHEAADRSMGDRSAGSLKVAGRADWCAVR